MSFRIGEFNVGPPNEEDAPLNAGSHEIRIRFNPESETVDYAIGSHVDAQLEASLLSRSFVLRADNMVKSHLEETDGECDDCLLIDAIKETKEAIEEVMERHNEQHQNLDDEENDGGEGLK